MEEKNQTASPLKVHIRFTPPPKKKQTNKQKNMYSPGGGGGGVSTEVVLRMLTFRILAF